MKKTGKRALISSFCALALIGGIAVVVRNGSDTLKVKATTECEEGNHEGNHYSELFGDETHNGHKEFYACCKCQHQYLTNPGGTFAEKTGFIELEDTHIAYLPKSTEVVVTHTVAGAPAAGNSFVFKKEKVSRVDKTVADLTLDLANTTLDPSTPAEIPANGLLDLTYNRTSALTEAMNYTRALNGKEDGTKYVWTLDQERNILSPAFITNLGSNSIEFVNDGASDTDGNALKMNIVETGTKWYGLLFNSDQKTLLENGGAASVMIKASEAITVTTSGGNNNISVTTEWQKYILSAADVTNALSNMIFGQARFQVYSTGSASIYFDDLKVDNSVSYGVNHYLAKDASSIPGTVSGYKLYKSETLFGNEGELTAATAITLTGFAAGEITQQTIAKTGTVVDIFYSRDMKVQSFEQSDLGWFNPETAGKGDVKLTNQADTRINTDKTGNTLFAGVFNSSAGDAWISYFLTDEQIAQVGSSKKLSFRVKLENQASENNLTYTLVSNCTADFSTKSLVSKKAGTGEWATITLTNFVLDSKNRVSFYIKVNQGDGFAIYLDDFIAL